MEQAHSTRAPWKFFLLTYAFSWTIWFPSVLDGLGLTLPFDAAGYSMVVVVIGAFAPLLAALTLIGRQRGWQGIKSFFRRAIDFQIQPVYWVTAFLLPLAIHLISHYLALALGLEVARTLFPEEIAVSPILLAIPYFFLMLLIGGGQEEFGWRGYAQEPLQKKYGPIPASLGIGLVWGVWHLPLWFMAGDLHSAYSFLAFVIMTMSISLIYTWLYNASGKKLLAVIVFHAMNNTAAPLLPFLHAIEGKPETAYWVYAGVNLFFGVLFAVLLVKRSQSIKEEILVS